MQRHRTSSPRLTSAALIAAIVAALFMGCSGGHGRGERGASTLTIKGSDTMVILAQRWAERYMSAHSDATIQVSGGGSGTGIAALINGTTDIANASRSIEDRERRVIRERHGRAPHETRVALDALAIYVHEDNPVRSLTITQLRRIYRGEIQRWSEVGGPDARIILYSRENNSGTYAYFKERVLDDFDFAAEAQTLAGTAAVVSAVSLDPGAIGYGGIAYGGGVRAIPIADDGVPVAPSLENAISGAYPLARYLFMYTVGEPEGLAARFIEWVLSPEGQAEVEAAGFYPLAREATSRAEHDRSGGA